jgi:hypothetical protein
MRDLRPADASRSRSTPIFCSYVAWLASSEEALRNILSLVDGSDEVEDVHALQVLLQSIRTLAEKGGWDARNDAPKFRARDALRGGMCPAGGMMRRRGWKYRRDQGGVVISLLMGVLPLGSGGRFTSCNFNSSRNE